MSVMIEIGS